jgi:hypothetical protein
MASTMGILKDQRKVIWMVQSFVEVSTALMTAEQLADWTVMS